MPVVHHKNLRSCTLHARREFKIDAAGRIFAADGTDPTLQEAARWEGQRNYIVSYEPDPEVVITHVMPPPPPPPPPPRMMEVDISMLDAHHTKIRAYADALIREYAHIDFPPQDEGESPTDYAKRVILWGVGRVV